MLNIYTPFYFSFSCSCRGSGGWEGGTWQGYTRIPGPECQGH